MYYNITNIFSNFYHYNSRTKRATRIVIIYFITGLWNSSRNNTISSVRVWKQYTPSMRHLWHCVSAQLWRQPIRATIQLYEGKHHLGDPECLVRGLCHSTNTNFEVFFLNFALFECRHWANACRPINWTAIPIPVQKGWNHQPKLRRIKEAETELNSVSVSVSVPVLVCFVSVTATLCVRVTVHACVCVCVCICIRRIARIDWALLVGLGISARLAKISVVLLAAWRLPRDWNWLESVSIKQTASYPVDQQSKLRIHLLLLKTNIYG